MTKDCGACGCQSHSNCAEIDARDKKLNESIENNNRKYTIKYRIDIENLECKPQELVDRIKAYVGIVDELEFTEEEIIISYDDRLITPEEIANLVH